MACRQVSKRVLVQRDASLPPIDAFPFMSHVTDRIDEPKIRTLHRLFL